MPISMRLRSSLVASALLIGLTGLLSPPSQADAPVAPAVRDGSHDFDFEFGTWKTRVRRLVHPLTGSSIWAEYNGTTVIRKIWGGKANMVELEVDGPSGHLELASLRLYNPDDHSWSLNVTSSRSGTLGVPTVGGFKDGRGEFYDKEIWDGKPITVRFVISNITANSAHFEQAFSSDDGKTWEMNWIADDTRTKDIPAS